MEQYFQDLVEWIDWELVAEIGDWVLTVFFLICIWRWLGRDRKINELRQQLQIQTAVNNAFSARLELLEGQARGSSYQRNTYFEYDDEDPAAIAHRKLREEVESAVNAQAQKASDLDHQVENMQRTLAAAMQRMDIQSREIFPLVHPDRVLTVVPPEDQKIVRFPTSPDDV